MSRLRLRALRVRVATATRDLGCDLTFSDGLNVIAAENNSGKSIAMQSILYALGMEAMLGPRHDVPLPDAMTKEISADGLTEAVERSEVWLELEGIEREPVTVVRWAKHPTIKRRLITAWDGAVLTGEGGATRRDFQVRGTGAFDEMIGFHRFLADLVGWDVPLVQTTKAVERPLYLEYLFSLLFVEQRGGWSGVQALQPNFFVAEARERSAEFLLGVDTYQRQRDERQLKSSQAAIEASWVGIAAQIIAAAERRGYRVTGVPSKLTPDLRTDTSVELVAASNRQALGAEVAALVERLQAADSRLRAPEPLSRDLHLEEGELVEETATVAVLDAATRSLERAVELEAETQRSLTRTLGSLRVDLRRNADALRIHELGAPAWASHDQECPTCHQKTTDVILPAGDKPGMSLKDNVAYLNAQIDALKLLEGEAAEAQRHRRLSLAQHRRQLSDARARLRAMKATVLTPEQVPSAAEIQRALIDQQRLRELHELDGTVATLLRHLVELASEARGIGGALKDLPPTSPSPEEKARVEELGRLVREQLSEYGFSSYRPAEVDVALPLLRPEREGTPVGYGISASDGVRLIWAHLLGLMELARTAPTRHPGIVMFDEPRQQSAKPTSLAAFLSRASRAVESDQQVLIATSEPQESLAAQLSGVEHHLVGFAGHLLKPLD